MNEVDRRNLYQGYIRLVAGSVFANSEWKQMLLDLPFGRRFAIDVADSKSLAQVIRELEECQSKGDQITPGLAWLDEARRHGMQVVEELRVIIFYGSDPEPVSESGSRLRIWFGSPLPEPDSETSARWYTIESVEFPDISMVFGFSA